MKIFEKDGFIHLELARLNSQGMVIEMLFDFAIKKEEYEELSSHIIEHLLAFKVE
jgi:hypothetical protein